MSGSGGVVAAVDLGATSGRVMLGYVDDGMLRLDASWARGNDGITFAGSRPQNGSMTTGDPWGTTRADLTLNARGCPVDRPPKNWRLIWKLHGGDGGI